MSCGGKGRLNGANGFHLLLKDEKSSITCKCRIQYCSLDEIKFQCSMIV